MGALLSQAVANQLRQVPQFQDPHPSPPTLIQQVLNQPGPSMPMWMAPVMERQQLLAQNTPEANRAAAQDALRMAMAFGGADITKEQRAAWEAENQRFRAGAASTAQVYEPGTRVSFKPVRATPGRPLPPNERGDMALGEGTIVDPASPEAGPPAYQPSTEATRRRPSPDHVAVRGDNSGHWFWRHRDSIEILPHDEWTVGTKVMHDRGFWNPREQKPVEWHGHVAKPPADAGRPPGPDYVWVDMEGEPDYFAGNKPYQRESVKPYKGSFGAWWPKKWLKKK